MSSHRDLDVWQASIDLVESIYKTTKKFPEDERFNLVSQIRRSAVSVPSNIAEGHGRKSNGDFGRFLKIAYGSSSELETQLIISLRLKLMAQKEYDEIYIQLTRVRKMLNGLITHLHTVSQTNDQ